MNEPIVRSIAISGNQTVEPETVRAALAFKPGEVLSSAIIDRSIKQLFATGHFADAHIAAGKDGQVTVVVVENARIASITFTGNHAIDSSQLEAAIGMKRGAPYTRARAHADELKIRDLYRHEGRYRTSVTSATTRTEHGRAGNAIALTFTIAEGDINKVTSISFAGNSAFSAVALRDVITTTQSGWLDILKSNLTYDPERLALDRLLLQRHYLTHGYADAQVGEAQVETDPQSNGFLLTFPIEEGERFTFGMQSIDDRLAPPRIVLLNDLKSRHGDVYDAAKIEASTEALGKVLAIAGQPFARVAPVLQRNAADRTIAVAYRIEDGPHIYIGRIDITGNARTRDAVIRRELRLADGDAYAAPLIEAARKRIMNTGFFKSVEIKPSRTADKDRVDLKVAVVEQDTGELSFGIGYSLTDGVIGDVSYSDRNMLGTGLTMKLKLEAGQKRYGAEVGFTDPHFLDSNVAAGFDLFYRDVDRTLQSSYKQLRYGGTLRIGIPVTDTVSTGLNYTFVHNTLYDVGAAASPAILEAAALGGGSYNTSSVGTSTTYDTRDSRKSPTSGIVATASQELAGIGGDTNFVRTTADMRGYYTPFDGITLAGRIGGGTIAGFGGQDVRLLDLFYRGGETVRGFAAAGLGPRDGLSANQDALGGKSYYVTSAELRTPVPLISPSLGLSAFAFADAGSVFGANTTAAKLPGLAANSAAPRASTGVGLVWNSPVGALQTSYGFALAKQPGDKVQPFSFGLGSGF